MTGLKMVIRGRVQGVYYRQTAFEKAIELGLTGFVKNQQDGSVLIEAYGPADKLDRFYSWCRRGPVMARVASVECETMHEITAHHTFRILK